MRRSALSLLVGILMPLLVLPGARADDVVPIEDFASYVPQTVCHPKPRLGTRELAAWVEQEFGGNASTAARGCGSGSSEHYDGRAIDWVMNAKKAKDRKKVAGLFAALLAPDAEGNPAALARRMGVMYLIWNDQMYPAWDQFVPKPYLSSSCRTKKKCSPTLRHRNHVHISLSEEGGRAKTSWYSVH